MESYKEIAFHDGIVTKENLPYPIVYYPGGYGSFFAFQRIDNSQVVFCECSRTAIENYIYYRLNETNRTVKIVFDRIYFPKTINDTLSKEIYLNEHRIFEYINFKDKLCHECNFKIPEYRYCHEMYGGIFEQTFGWYINKQAFEFGIIPISNTILYKKCPQFILDLIDITQEEYEDFWNKNHNNFFYSKESEEFYRKYHNQFKKIWKVIENEVRLKFGFKKIGKNTQSSELILYYILKSIFPTYNILRNYKPKFLECLEIDFYIQELNIGIEYQGEQHFKPVTHWGGEKGFEELKKRDKLKKKLCSQNKVKLIYFDYSDGLNENIVKSCLNV